MISSKVWLKIFVALLILHSNALACTVPPIQRETAESALRRAEWVGLVTVRSIKVEAGKLSVKIGDVERLAGDGHSPSSIVFPCKSCEGGAFSSEAADQLSLEFYTGGTSLGFTPACEIVPAVRIGGRYLHVRTNPLSLFVLEEVNDSSRWLEAAEGYIRSGKFAPLSVSEYVRQTRKRVFECISNEFPAPCKMGYKKYLRLMDKSGFSSFNYPVSDGCFKLAEGFQAAYGFDLNLRAEDDIYCLDPHRK